MCILGRTGLGPTEFPIISGNSDMNSGGRSLCCLCRIFQWNEIWCKLGLGVFLLNLVACSGLDLLSDPKASDLQLTVDVLNVSLKDAHQAMAELRAEIEVRNQELAETQVIRAQLEGRVREAEHRLSEARQVIGLQREELAESRADRERTARTGAVLQSQLKQLRKQLSRVDKQAYGGISPTVMDLPVDRQPRPVPVDMKETGSLDDPSEVRRALPQSDGMMSGADSVESGAVLTQPVMPATPSQIMIKHGDTLWSLAHRYRTSVHQLMVVNALSSDYIQAGQSLWLPGLAGDGSAYERR